MVKKNLSIIILIISILFLITVIIYKFILPKQEFTEITIDNYIIKVGERLPNDKIERTFNILNTGKTDLLIFDVQADCHCTIVDWPKSPISKGNSAEIVVGYDNQNIGYFQQAITIDCNVKDSPIILILQGETVKSLSNESF